MTGKMNTTKLKKIKIRGDKCFERVMLEQQVIHEHHFGEEKIA
ncbi:hypothetical protein [Bacillus sp. M6-12]|nr:hypothetical protein [Bacillus sp. M6-12]